MFLLQFLKQVYNYYYKLHLLIIFQYFQLLINLYYKLIRKLNYYNILLFLIDYFYNDIMIYHEE